MNKHCVLFLMLALVCGALAGCDGDADRPATSDAEIVGTYKGGYADGTEIIEIHADGTFAQKFNGETNAGYTSSGKWIYETNTVVAGRTNLISRLSFKPFIVPAGIPACTTNTKFDVAPGSWRRNPIRIELGPWPYFVAKTSDHQMNESQKKSPAEMMREMRLKMLAAPAELKLQPSTEFPRVCGVVMDRPMQAGEANFICTVVSLSTGDASIYTTGTFGVLGGIGHEAVRNAAKNLVRTGEKYFDDATLTTDFAYPKSGRVRFFLVCYDGVRAIDADLGSMSQGKDKYSDLFNQSQNVITELRLITQKQKGEK